jgi:hypothetical protein
VIFVLFVWFFFFVVFFVICSNFSAPETFQVVPAGFTLS